MAGKVIIVQGGQWGSEAKGLITHKLTLEKRPGMAIRTGTINAGHTVYYKGKAYAMQQLPVSWVDPQCILVLGPGAYINPAQLIKEILWIAEAQDQTPSEVIKRIWIDWRCGIHLSKHQDAALLANRHHSIGTTGKGCSEAVVGKIMGRDRDYKDLPLFGIWNNILYADLYRELQAHIIDTISMVNRAYDDGCILLVEGTQGTLLDLHLGPYPYTTHKQTQAANWLAEAGLSCNVNKELWCIYRTYPIRVAGNSGPMPGEISWVDLTRSINAALPTPLVQEYAIEDFLRNMEEARRTHYPDLPADVPTEPALWTAAQRSQFKEYASEIHRLALGGLAEYEKKEAMKLWEVTTVTKKLRRIARWDWDTYQYSISLNRPDHIALTFMNYAFPSLWGTQAEDITPDRMGEVDNYVNQREDQAQCPVSIVSFGPQINNTLMVKESHITGRYSW